MQTEYSLWTRNAEIAVLQACQDIGATFVAFSPVARGYLSDAPPDPAAFDPRDIRSSMPRFSSPHWPANLALRQRAATLARGAGCTLSQLALAWVLTRGDHVLPIPGTTNEDHLRENVAAADITLAPATLQALDALINQGTVSGARDGAQSATEVDTEEFDTAPR